MAYTSPQIHPLCLTTARATCAPEPSDSEACMARGGIPIYGLERKGVPGMCLVPMGDNQDALDFVSGVGQTWMDWIGNGGATEIVQCYLDAYGCGGLKPIETAPCVIGCPW